MNQTDRTATPHCPNDERIDGTAFARARSGRALVDVSSTLARTLAGIQVVMPYATRSSWRIKRDPQDACWPPKLLQHWHADGGTLTLNAVGSCLPPAKRALYMDHIGSGLATVELQPVHVPEGLLGAASTGDSACFDHIAHALFDDGWAVVNLGAPSCIWPTVQAEGERLWPQMQPGRLSRSDGSYAEGISPSGSKRGDRFIPLSAANNHGTWPVLQLLDRALAIIGTHLSASLLELTGRRLYARTPPGVEPLAYAYTCVPMHL